MIEAPAGLQGWLHEHHGLRIERARCVAQLDCEIYRLRATGSPTDWALRIYRPRVSDAAGIADEVTWLAALGAEGCHVPTPLRGLDGRFIQPWLDGRLAVVLSWVEGRLLDKGLRPVHLARVGRLVGAMHRVAERLVADGELRSGRPGDGPDLKRWIAGRPHPALPARTHDIVQHAARRLQAEWDGFTRSAAGWGFIHSDLHLWNLLFAGRHAAAIDFSECGFGPHALDLAAVLQYVKHPVVDNHDHTALYPNHRAALLEGYASERALPPGFEQQIDTCIEVRMINTIEWVLDCWPSVDARPWGRALLQRVDRFFTG